MLLRANALAKGYSGARVETVELLIECLNRGVLPHVPARGSVGASGDLAPLAHLALPLVGEGRATVDGELLSGRGRPRCGRARADAAPRQGGAVADQRDAVHGGDGVARPRPRAAAGADGRSRVRALARGAAGLAHELPSRRSTTPARSRVSATRPRTSGRCSRARRSSSRIAGATRCRTRTRCAARRRCTAPAATCSTTSSATVSVELNAATDNPLVLVDEGLVVSNGNFHGQPLAFALDTLAMAVAELARHLGATRRAARQPVALGGPAAVPHAPTAGSTPGS